MGCQGGEEASVMSCLQEHPACPPAVRSSVRRRHVGSAGPHSWIAGHARSGYWRVRDEAIWSDTMSCNRHGRRLAVEASEEARSGPDLAQIAIVWEWHERMVRRVFPARVWTRLSCVTGKKFSWSDSQAQSLAARTAGAGMGNQWNLGSGNMDKQVEAEDSHCGDTCDACAATRLITARIMPTPGTEIAKASLADSSPAWLTGHDKVATGKLSGSISHLDSGVRSCAEAIRVCGGRVGHMLTPALPQHHLSQACRSKPLLECLGVWMVQLNARPRQAGVSQTDDRCAVRSN